MGKTLLAQRLAARLGCRYIMDEWHPGRALALGALHLTSEPVEVPA